MRIAGSAVILSLLATAALVVGDEPLLGQQPERLQLRDLLGQRTTGKASATPDLTIKASLERSAGNPADVVLRIHVDLPDGYYIYSTNPAVAGATRLAIVESRGVEPVDSVFKADRAPKRLYDPFLEKDVEKFYGSATWSRTFRMLDATRTSEVVIQGTLEGTYCSEGQNGKCIFIKPPREFRVTLTGDEGVPPAAEPVFTIEKRSTRMMRGQERDEPIEFQFQLDPPNAQPGEEVTLSVTARPDSRYHIFALTQDPENSGLPTEITIEALNGLEAIHNGFVPSKAPEINETFEGKEQQIHHGEVTFTQKLRVRAAAESNGYGVRGKVTYQICNPISCRQGTPIVFALGAIDAQSQDFAAAKSDTDSNAAGIDGGAELAAVDFGKLKIRETTDDSSTAFVLLTAFVAGFILNFMPCVLPVIGLKIMGFVQQSADSRGRIFMLNLWFSLGLLSVFLVLASLAVFASMGWGAQFESVTFKVVLTAIVFAFALSFLGVWDIPIPGFAGSGKGVEMADQEGIAGAFSKGILTTVLATPCSGPMLGPALAWAVSQPTHITYAGFTCVGLGMASPYLLIGAFPGLIGFLPKPGAWMETFKHIMGFVLLGTVVFLLTLIPLPYVVPMVAAMMGLWAACWWIGRTPLTENLPTKLKAWAQAGVFAALVGYVSFGWLFEITDSRFQALVERTIAERGGSTRAAVLEEIAGKAYC